MRGGRGEVAEEERVGCVRVGRSDGVQAMRGGEGGAEGRGGARGEFRGVDLSHRC